MARSEDLATLSRFLCQSFGADELRRFVASLPDVGDLLDQVPGPTAAPADICLALVSGLERRNLLDARFFIKLHLERPRCNDLPTQLDGLAARLVARGRDPGARMRARGTLLLAILFLSSLLAVLLDSPSPVSPSTEYRPVVSEPQSAADAPDRTELSQSAVVDGATTSLDGTHHSAGPGAACIVCNNHIQAPGGRVALVGIQEGR